MTTALFTGFRVIWFKIINKIYILFFLLHHIKSIIAIDPSFIILLWGSPCNLGLNCFVMQMVEPQYQEMLKKEVPHISEGGVHVSVIAGTALGVTVSTTCKYMFIH